METTFSTDLLRPRDRLKVFRQIMNDRFGLPAAFDHARTSDFEAHFRAYESGQTRIIHARDQGLQIDLSASHLRARDRGDNITFCIKLRGHDRMIMGDVASHQGPGDCVLVDSHPYKRDISPGNESILVSFPRKRIEEHLGPARLYAGSTIAAGFGSTRLVLTYFRELLSSYGSLGDSARARMMEIGIDLVHANIAEHLEQHAPKPIHGTIVVQRAKAFIQANLSDPSLSPASVAAAIGISLRRLQELFQERGQYVADWIWDRRLILAAERLADPGRVHLRISAIAFGCGFSDQAHFSRRFRERHDVTPRDFRRRAMGLAV